LLAKTPKRQAAKKVAFLLNDNISLTYNFIDSDNA